MFCKYTCKELCTIKIIITTYMCIITMNSRDLTANVHTSVVLL